jgi:phosphoserine phosphatase
MDTEQKKRLVVLDMDSTFIQQEVIDLIARAAGVGEQVAQITERAMRGEIDFKQSLAERVKLLKDLPVETLEKVRQEIDLSQGAERMVKVLQALGHKVAIVSGGFEDVIGPLLEKIGVDYYRANSFETYKGKLTGVTRGPLIDRKAKADALKEFAARCGVPLAQTVAVGDGANDLDMMALSGLSIAFNAKPVVQAAAKAAINDGNLENVLFLMGITQEEIDSTGL